MKSVSHVILSAAKDLCPRRIRSFAAAQDDTAGFGRERSSSRREQEEAAPKRDESRSYARSPFLCQQGVHTPQEMGGHVCFL